MKSDKRPAMSKCRAGALILILLSLGACSVIPDGPPALAEHDLGPSSLDQSFQPRDLPVHLAVVTTAGGLAGTDILYRRSDRDPTRIQRYAQHVWRVAPAMLIADRLAQLGLSARASAETPYRLNLRLVDFEQVITTPADAHVNVRIDAELRNAQGEQLATYRFIDRSPTMPDLTGALRGLTAAARRQADNINQWVFDVLPR